MRPAKSTLSRRGEGYVADNPLRRSILATGGHSENAADLKRHSYQGRLIATRSLFYTTATVPTSGTRR